MKHVRQNGVALFVVLILLVAMTVGAATLIRSVETSNQVSSNISYRSVSSKAAEVGFEAALKEISTIIPVSSEAKYPSGCSSSDAYPTACRYFPLVQPLDSAGVPVGVVWANIQSIEPIRGFRVKYVIERLCAGSLPIADVFSSCKTLPPSNGGTKKANEVAFTAASQTYYRVTVRVDGPRSTLSYTRAVFSI